MLEGIKEFAIDSKDGGVLHHADLPFEARRVYWLSGPHLGRGAHAHKELLQVLVCVSGEASILFSNGLDHETIRLRQSQGVFVSKGIWRDILPMKEGDKLMVFASELFDEQDYIRDFAAFLSWRNV